MVVGAWVGFLGGLTVVLLLFVGFLVVVGFLEVVGLGL